MQPSQKIVHLRQALSDKIPNLRTLAEQPAPKQQGCWPTGLAQIDGLLHGGLPKGGVSELVCEKAGSGSALVLQMLLRRAAETNALAALIDAQDSFDATALGSDALSRLLWIRCQSAEQALKAADLVLRDRNLAFVALDLMLSPPVQLRKLSSSTWFRLQRIVEQTSAVFLVVTPKPIVGCAHIRVTLHGRSTLDDIDVDPSELMSRLKFEVTARSRSSQQENALSRSA